MILLYLFSVTITKQFVYMIDRDITLNVFDCVNTVTNQREVYYIQEGGSDGTITFKKDLATYTPHSRSSHPSMSQPSLYQSILCMYNFSLFYCLRIKSGNSYSG